MYRSVSEKFAWKIWRLKNTGGGNHPSALGSSRVNRPGMKRTGLIMNIEKARTNIAHYEY